ncbi:MULTISPECIES: aminoglycoside phosphotransferase family protein [unclassified Achromobacter]|uniref:aminoglycoside phosphotransferase family protein n=1 Tax=unclassified Achromobacter TaxID=2626865 RepID=UPI000B51B236|nr:MULTISPECIES: phosphotransferase [unclassified Achromobacter]OWT71591.1 aminoglycoside phosphotransferase [Achromobacter sp. HZ34]OWT73248.1 aminoglycoside phosphotransferase [Achromobacter sp. HZ28]
MNTTPDTRQDQIRQWLLSLPADLGLDVASLAPASSDASFRRYFRLNAAAGSLIVMDAPPEREDCRPFIHVAGLLGDAGLNVPRILAQDLAQGLLLLTDLGRDTYYQRIQAGLPDAELQTLYRQALAALVRVQQAATTGLPTYDTPRLAAELELFPEWYVGQHHGMQLDATTRQSLDRIFALLSASNGAQPPVLVHRDFHSPNLMVCDEDRYGPNPGVIDFQDALAGPITYDLASLVTDARTTWEEPQQLDWAIRYWEMARAAQLPVDADFADFHRAYEWMSLQRNLRILGVFARLHHRDGKAGYLAHIPRVNAYVRQVAARYGVFTPLLRLLDKLDDRQPVVGYTF